jgi:hypothetical protein
LGSDVIGKGGKFLPTERVTKRVQRRADELRKGQQDRRTVELELKGFSPQLSSSLVEPILWITTSG